jgi:calcium-dependent protein kinase
MQNYILHSPPLKTNRVYKCTSKNDGKYYIYKYVTKKEASIATALSGKPGIAKVKEMFELPMLTSHGRHVLIEEYYAHGNLLEAIENNVAFQNETILKGVVNGIASCHEEFICHGDVKPANILLDGSGNSLLCDFGSASLCHHDLFQSNIRGTPYFIAPEVFRHAYNIQADIWSLGILIYYLIYKKYPYVSETLNKDFVDEVYFKSFEFPAISACQANIFSLMLRCLNRDPEKRITIQQAKCLLNA